MSNYNDDYSFLNNPDYQLPGDDDCPYQNEQPATKIQETNYGPNPNKPISKAKPWNIKPEDRLENSIKKAMDAKRLPIYTGIKQLDSSVLISGLDIGYHLIIGETSGGKTAIANYIADNMAFRDQLVVFISYEESSSKIDYRSMARIGYELDGESALSISQISAANHLSIPQEKLDRLKKEYLKRSHGKKIVIEDNLSLSQIETMIEDLDLEYHQKPVIFIDHIQHMMNTQRPARGVYGQRERMDGIIADIIRISKEKEVVFIILSQISRELSISSNKAIDDHLLKKAPSESKKLEEGSGLMLYIRDDGQDKKLAVVKNRYGDLLCNSKAIPFKFRPEYGYFEEKLNKNIKTEIQLQLDVMEEPKKEVNPSKNKEYVLAPDGDARVFERIKKKHEKRKQSWS